jgi:hypothetical protein
MMTSKTNPRPAAPTQPTPAPVDLDGLIADLKLAGWTQDEGRFFDLSNVWRNGKRGITLTSDGPFIWAERLMEPFGPINILDPIWQHALDIIRRHTQPTEGA